MKLDLFLSAPHIDELQLREKNVAVIDVLRSSTTIAHALHNGAREIIPVESIEKAVKVSGSLFGDVTLRGGERNGKVIPGFNLGNSPTEYSEQTVKGKSIIYCTTNGSVALVKSRHARHLIVASFVNMSKVVEFMAGLNSEFTIVCAGRPMTSGGFSLEDAVCAGMIISLLGQKEGITLELDDAAVAAKTLYKSLGRSIFKLMKLSEHGRYLEEIGFGADLKVCSEIDSIGNLPMWIGGGIRTRRDDSVPPESLPGSDSKETAS